MTSSFRYRRRVEFAETDMAGILHFANFFRYMEECEHALFRSLGLRIHTGEQGAGKAFGWARGRASCEYERPLRYDDIVEIELAVREKRRVSIRYEFTFRRCADAEGAPEPDVCARGSVTAVCIGQDGDGRMRALDMPADVDAAVTVAPDRTDGSGRGT